MHLFPHICVFFLTEMNGVSESCSVMLHERATQFNMPAQDSLSHTYMKSAITITHAFLACPPSCFLNWWQCGFFFASIKWTELRNQIFLLAKASSENHKLLPYHSSDHLFQHTHLSPWAALVLFLHCRVITISFSCQNSPLVILIKFTHLCAF